MSRDELHELVEALPDEQVDAVAADLKVRLAQPRVVSWPPSWVGIAQGSAPDISERVDEILAEGLGQRRA